MTIVDFKEQKEARRRAEWERLVAWQERELATARRVLEVLEPIVNQLLKQKRVRATPVRGARVLEHDHDSPPGSGSHFRRCPALVALCARIRRRAQRRFRVNADDADTLSWAVVRPPRRSTVPADQVPRRRASKARAHRGPMSTMAARTRASAKVEEGADVDRDRADGNIEGVRVSLAVVEMHIHRAADCDAVTVEMAMLRLSCAPKSRRRRADRVELRRCGRSTP